MQNEVWKTIKGFDNYEVSNYGRVKSKSRTFMRKNPRWKNAPKQKIKTKEKIINGWIKKNIRPELRKKPYVVMVSLRKDNKTYTKRLHRLVLETFIGPCPDGFEGCHNDGDPTNNCLQNLRWDTHKNNLKDCHLHGTYSPPPILKGEDHHMTTISNIDVKRIREKRYYYGLYTDLAKQYNTTITTISRIYKKESRCAA